MRPRRWIGAGAVIALALTLVTIHSLDAPLFLYPSSASLPAGLYMQSFETVRVGSIVAFPVPDVAQRYQELSGIDVSPGHLFIKPITAGPGDLVCSDPENGLVINDVFVAPVVTSDDQGRRLPIWHSCRWLRKSEFFVFSDAVTNSFDSRHYGPLLMSSIIGTYRRHSCCVPF